MNFPFAKHSFNTAVHSFAELRKKRFFIMFSIAYFKPRFSDLLVCASAIGNMLTAAFT